MSLLPLLSNQSLQVSFAHGVFCSFPQHKHCTPAALEMYYSEQEVGPQGSLYTAINHLNQGKKTIPELPSPWLPVINALKEGEKGKEDPAGIQQ